MFSLRDAMAVGSIALSTEFFSLTQGLIQVKQQMEDELRNYCVIVEVRAFHLALEMDLLF